LYGEVLYYIIKMTSDGYLSIER